MTDLSEQDKALCEALDAAFHLVRFGGAGEYIANGDLFGTANSRIRELSAQLAEHPTATDWQNRAERAEQEAAELRERLESTGWGGLDGIACRDETIQLQTDAIERLLIRSEALEQHAVAMAEALSFAENCDDRVMERVAYESLANWTAWLIDNPLAQGD